MSTNYEITYSDGALTFIVSPYSANGPASPSSEILYTGAIKAETSLVIVGKGTGQYGERMQENMVHLLEHFSGELEPKYPIGGQIWCDRSGSVVRLKVYNIKKLINISPIQSEIWIDDDQTARFGITPNKISTIRIFSNVDFSKEDYKISGVIYEAVNKRTKIAISNPKGIRNGWFIGDWDDIITSSGGITDAISSRITNVITNTNYDLDAVNVKTLNESLIDTPIPLGNLTDVEIEIAKYNDVLFFDTDDSTWKNINLTKAIQQEGELSLGGDLDVNGHTINGFGKDMDLNHKKIVNVGYPDDYDSASEFHAVNVGYLLKKMPGGGDNGVSQLKHLSDVNTNLSPFANDLLYFDGSEWSNLAISNVGSILSFIPLSGTSAGSGDQPYYLDKNALIHYNPASDFHSGEENIRTKIGNYGLVTLGMGDTLWGESSDTKVEFGGYDGSTNTISLGWGRHSPQYPIIPGQTVPENPDGVKFGIDVYESTHRAFDPKGASTDGLYFEKSLSRTVDTYPYVTLNKIVHVVNKSLGDITLSPYRGMFDGADINSSPQTLPYNFLVGKSNLDIYKNGLKQYASLKNWVKTSLEPDGSGNTGYVEYSVVYAHMSTGADDFNYLIVNADETMRFNELGKLGQQISVVNSDGFDIHATMTINPDVNAQYDAGAGYTYIYVIEEPVWDGEPPDDYFIRVDNEYNVGDNVWGGYPTGLDVTKTYMLKLTVDGNTLYPYITGSNNLDISISKNIAQIVDSINDWSKNNGEEFAAYIEGGSIYFFPTASGDITIDVDNDISGSLSYPNEDIDGVYDDPSAIGVNMAFDTNTDVTNDFLPGLQFEVENSSSGNNGIYQVSEVELLPGNVTRIFVKEGSIPSTTAGGDMIIYPLSLFEQIVGGVTLDRTHYYYKFTDPITWPKKSDEANLIFDGDYEEIGMIGLPSNQIKWVNAPIGGDTVEIIVRNAVE